MIYKTIREHSKNSFPVLHLTDDIANMVYDGQYTVGDLQNVTTMFEPESRFCERDLLFLVPSAPSNTELRDKCKVSSPFLKFPCFQSFKS